MTVAPSASSTTSQCWLVLLVLSLLSISIVHGQPSSSIRGEETRSRSRPSSALSPPPVDDRPAWERLFDNTPSSSSSSSHLRRTKQVDDETETTQIFCQYKNPKGRQDAIKVATHVLHDFEDDHLLALSVNRQAAKYLFEDPHIGRIEADSLWTEQGFLEQTYTNTTLHHRALLEQTPYGIVMTQANQVTMGNAPVEVCIVDTGLALGHPDFVRSSVNGASRRSNMDDALLDWKVDLRGHGTHVAGTIAAHRNNNQGVRGMGEIDIYITRGLNNQGTAWESDVREAMQQCRQRGAKIISLSLAGGSMSLSMEELVDSMYRDGYLILAAAGNKGQYYEAFPAGHPRVISVAAVRENERYWSGSNYGPWLEISAPGHKILSTAVDKETGDYIYAEYSGTSMATPHVAGAAAILWSHHPTCTNDQIRYALMYTAQDVGGPGCDDDYGYGILKVKNALDFLDANPCHADTNWGQTSGSETGRCDTIQEIPDPLPEVTEVAETPAPTPAPSPEPTPQPSPLPTPRPSPLPTPLPTPSPTPEPTPSPTPRPTRVPTPLPTERPTVSDMPSSLPSKGPTANPTVHPTPRPTSIPTPQPTPLPTLNPTPSPTPTPKPTPRPTLGILIYDDYDGLYRWRTSNDADELFGQETTEDKKDNLNRKHQSNRQRRRRKNAMEGGS